MIKKMNKKGQFFLIAAVIISISIVSIISFLKLPSEFNNPDIESNKIHLMNFNSFLERYNSIINSNWYNFKWNERARVILEEESGIGKEGVIKFDIRLPNDTNLDSLRLTNEGRVIPFAVNELSKNKYEVYFESKIEPYEVKDYFLYFSNESGFERMWDDSKMVSYNESGNNMVYTDYYWGRITKDGIVELGVKGENTQDLLTGDARSLISCSPGNSPTTNLYPQNCPQCKTEISIVQDMATKVVLNISGDYREQKVHLYPENIYVEERIKSIPNPCSSNVNYKYQTGFNQTALPDYDEEDGDELSCSSSGSFTPGEWLEVSKNGENSITQFFLSNYESFRYFCEPGNWSFNSTVSDSASIGNNLETEIYPGYGKEEKEEATVEIKERVEFQSLEDFVREEITPSRYHYTLSFSKGNIFEIYEGQSRWKNESKNRTVLCYENTYWNLPTEVNIHLPSNANYNTTTLWDGQVIPYQRNGSKFIFNKRVGSKFLDVYYSSEDMKEKNFETDLEVSSNYVENRFFKWNLSSGNFTTDKKNWFTSEEWRTCRGDYCENGLQNLEADGGPIRARVKGTSNQVNYTFYIYSDQPIIKVKIESNTQEPITSGPYWKVGGIKDEEGWCERIGSVNLPYNFSSALKEGRYTYCSKGNQSEVASIITKDDYRSRDSIRMKEDSIFVKIDPTLDGDTYYLAIGENGEAKSIEGQLENKLGVKQNLLRFNVSSQLGRFSFQKRNFFSC